MLERTPTHLRHALLVVALSATAGSAVVVLSLGASTGAVVTSHLAQLAADLTAMALCIAVAVSAEGIGRLSWSILAGGLACWVAGDTVMLVTAAAGPGATAALVSDAFWVLAGLCFLVAVVLMYARVRPERGWQGALDALALTVSLGIVAWAVVLRPLHGGEEGVVDASWLIFPALAIAAATIAGWLVLRLRGGPHFLRLTFAALVLTSAGEVLHLGEALGSADDPIGAWLLFTAAGWTLAIAAADRLAHPRSRLQRAEGEPPSWSDALPAAATLSAVAVLAVGEGVLGAAVMLATAIASVRMVTAGRTAARLIEARGAEAATDPLTGALNRRRLAEDLHRLTATSRRSGARLCALAIDLDGFKAVNDTHGHVHGDRLLLRVVGTLRGHLRAGDLLYRVGGDEFVALLPDTPASEALAVAERLRARTAEEVGTAGVTISLGVAEGPPRWSPPESLLEEADAALYRAKASGRDRVVGAPLPRSSGPGPVLGSE
ncbi:MAG: GGDEF domain-containing protein [Miltoncostaeaceae bacterium]